MTESIRDQLINLLDRNFGYTEEERAEVVADRIIRAGLAREDEKEPEQ